PPRRRRSSVVRRAAAEAQGASWPACLLYAAARACVTRPIDMEVRQLSDMFARTLDAVDSTVSNGSSPVTDSQGDAMTRRLLPRFALLLALAALVAAVAGSGAL